MAAFLTTDESDSLDWIVDYLENAGTDRPVDDKVAEQLSRMHDSFGWDSEVKFREDLRDAPVLTLIKGLVYLNENA